MKTGNKQKKILVMTNHSFMLWQFRRELIQKLLEDSIVYISMPMGERTEDFQQIGCIVCHTPLERRGIDPIQEMKLCAHYRKLLKEIKPDKVITYSIKPNIYGGFLSRKAGIPYYVNVQGLGTAFQIKGLDKVVTLMYRAALKKARTVFFENVENAQEFINRKIIPEEKITVLKGAGVNLEHYPLKPYSEENGIRFVYVGRIMREKGMDELLEAAQIIKKEFPDKVFFDIAGFYEEEYRDKVEQLQEEGVLQFHGFLEDVRPFYANSSCIVMPSYHEGMSNVLLEAAATGRALITSDIPGCREAVKNGESGFLCEAKSVYSLVDAMRKFIALDSKAREEMGKQGRCHMEQTFDKNLVIQETIEKLCS